MAGKNKKKIVYPEKQTMNLYYKPDRTTVPATIALYVLFGLTVLLALGKIGVFDPLYERSELRDQLARAQEQRDFYAEQLQDYDEVRSRYLRYALTDDEAEQTDRMEIMGLLDEILRPAATIESVAVSEGDVNVAFSGVTLEQAAELVRRLESSELVHSVWMDTAATVQDADKRVTANIRISLEKESGEEAAEQ